MEKIGALWENEGKKGKYLSGNVQGVNVVIFTNGYKKEGKHPDWIIYLKEDQPPKQEEPPVHNDSEIPF